MIGKIKNKIKFIRIDKGWFDHTSEKGGRVLMYHGVDSQGTRKFNSRHFGVEEFEEHLKYFKKKFTVVTTQEFFEIKNLRSKRFVLALTFDDGYENNLTNAFPLLEALSIPATFYVTGLQHSKHKIIWADAYDILRANVSDPFTFSKKVFSKNLEDNKYYTVNGESFEKIFKADSRTVVEKIDELHALFPVIFKDVLNDESNTEYWKLLRDEQILACDKSKFIEIGSHGYYHSNLGGMKTLDAVQELKKSKEHLENLLKKSITELAYPDGSYNDQIAGQAFNMGFKYQMAVNYKSNTDSEKEYLTDRFGLYPLRRKQRVARYAHDIIGT